jgi:hypothetical protein
VAGAGREIKYVGGVAMPCAVAIAAVLAVQEGFGGIFGINLAMLSVSYGLSVEEELASIFPESEDSVW